MGDNEEKSKNERQKAGQKLKETTRQVAETVERAADQIERAVDEAEEEADKVERGAKRAREAAEERADEEVDRAVDRGKEEARRATDRALDYLGDRAKKAARGGRERKDGGGAPSSTGQQVAFGGAVGCVAGLLDSRLSAAEPFGYAAGAALLALQVLDYEGVLEVPCSGNGSSLRSLHPGHRAVSGAMEAGGVTAGAACAAGCVWSEAAEFVLQYAPVAIGFGGAYLLVLNAVRDAYTR